MLKTIDWPLSKWGLIAISCIIISFCTEPVDRSKGSISDMLENVKPKSPSDALSTFEIEPGFKLELAVGEPEVVDPIDIAWDEHGRMYVAEYRDYPNGPFPERAPESRIRILEDLDKDGYYERSEIFADRIRWASSVCVWRKGIFVAAAPEILYLRDYDGDNKADVIDTLYTGFGTRVSEDILNGLKLGLDGWIYGVASYNGGDVYLKEDPDHKTSVRRSDFRFHPDTRVFEAISGGNGDFGNCFDDWGRRYVTNANNPSIHIVLPKKYIDRNPLYVPNRVYQSVVQIPDDYIFQISPPES
ncbi:MAG: hypothetical protein OEQ53_21900, partial [Saprospiraceae bacterium]|nr:hypothetical protein [Saprospiraceae bacterium]